MLKNNKGITLIAVVVTVLILTIIVGITITKATQGVNESKSNKLLSELDMVQHAVLERYTKYSLTKNSDLLVGTKTEANDSNVDWKVKSPSKEEEYYYELNQEELEKLGITNTDDTYIVNYKTGEVFNKTKTKTANGELLYKYSTTDGDE